MTGSSRSLLTHASSTCRHDDRIGGEAPACCQVSRPLYNGGCLVQSCPLPHWTPTGMEKEKIPDSTQGKLSLIASGRAAAEMVPELLNATLDASDYGKALESFPEKQEYIDGLNKVYPSSCYHSEHPTHLVAIRLSVPFPLSLMTKNGVCER